MTLYSTDISGIMAVLCALAQTRYCSLVFAVSQHTALKGTLTSVRNASCGVPPITSTKGHLGLSQKCIMWCPTHHQHQRAPWPQSETHHVVSYPSPAPKGTLASVRNASCGVLPITSTKGHLGLSQKRIMWCPTHHRLLGLNISLRVPYNIGTMLNTLYQMFLHAKYFYFVFFTRTTAW